MRILTTLGLGTALFLSAPLAAAGDPPSFRFQAGYLPESGDVIVFAGPDGLASSGAALDAALGGQLSAALTRHEFSGEFSSAVSFNAMADFGSVTVIGTGEETLTKRQLHELGGHAATQADDDTFVIADALLSDVASPGAHIAAGFALRSYAFDDYKYKSDDASADETDLITLHVDAPSETLSLYQDDLAHMIEGTYLARDLGTEPGNIIYPQTFVERVRPKFQGVPNVRVRVLNEADIRREKMGVLLGTARGSVHEPRLMVISYMGGTQGDAPLALVGKGVTFDTGGINLKSGSSMWYMKSDLSGAAAVAGTILAAAKRAEQINLVGVMPLSENMPSAEAIRPGDVLVSMGGKSIEIGSTDAEGRLQLADAVQYTQKEFSPYMMLDIATLTGSAASALGTDYAALFSRDDDLARRMVEIGQRAGEDVWHLPLNDGHFKQIESDIADIKSTAGRPGASLGAAVIGTFVDEDLPWVHLDIAGVDWADSPNATTPKGHAGWGVRFMDELVRDQASK